VAQWQQELGELRSEKDWLLAMQQNLAKLQQSLAAASNTAVQVLCNFQIVSYNICMPNMLFSLDFAVTFLCEFAITSSFTVSHCPARDISVSPSEIYCT